MNPDDPTLLEQFPGGISKREETPEMPLSRNQRRIAKKTIKKKSKGKSSFDTRSELRNTHKSFGELIQTYVETLKGFSNHDDDEIAATIAPAIGALEVATTSYENVREKLDVLSAAKTVNEDLYWEAFTTGNEMVEDIQTLNEVVHPILDRAFELAEEKEEHVNE